MPKTLNRPAGEDPPADKDDRDLRPPDEAVRAGVLAALGRPPGLFGVAVRPLWGNHYRVNVLVGPEVSSVQIAHSFFVQAGAGGDILSATPPITRQYP